MGIHIVYGATPEANAEAREAWETECFEDQREESMVLSMEAGERKDD